MNRTRSRTRVVAEAGQVTGNLENEVVILCMANGIYYSLTEVGAQVWTWIQQPVDVGKLVQRITEMYEVDAAQARSDLLELIDDLVAKGLVRYVDESAD